MNERLAALLEAVKSTELGGIQCNDVNGKNWFDERSELLRLIAMEDALGVCVHGIALPGPCGMCDHEKWNELRVKRMTDEAQKIRLELIRKTYDRENLAKEMTDKIKKLRDWCDAMDNGDERSLPSIVRDLDEILALNSDKKAEPKLARFVDLPLGTRFRYRCSKSTWVVLENHGRGLIAKWYGSDHQGTQEVCSFAYTEEECVNAMVEVVG